MLIILQRLFIVVTKFFGTASLNGTLPYYVREDDYDLVPPLLLPPVTSSLSSQPLRTPGALGKSRTNGAEPMDNRAQTQKPSLFVRVRSCPIIIASL